MNTNSNAPERSSCTYIRELMEQALSEEPLSTEQQREHDAHLRQCDACRDRLKLISNLSDFADGVTADQLDDRIAFIMDQLRQERLRRRNYRMALGMAAALLVLGGALWIWLVHFRSNDVESPGAPWTCEVSAPIELVDGVFMTFCRESDPGSTIDNGDVLVTLHRGTVGLYVNPERSNRNAVSVQTPFGEVQVRGTLFTVHVDDADAHVEVFRGIVEVVSLQGNASDRRVYQGQKMTLANRRIDDLSEPRTAFMLTALPIDSPTLSSADIPAETTGESRISHIEEMDTSVASKAKKADHASVARPISRKRVDTSDVSMESLIQEAQSCLLDKDWQGAAERYRKVLRIHANRKESTAVRISLARIELNHLDAPKRALTHFNAYLQFSPTGPLCEEALLGKAEAHRRLGQKTLEKNALQLFLHRFPKSSQASRARKRLEQVHRTLTTKGPIPNGS